MKNIIIALFLLIVFNSNAQVNGNGKLVTKSYPLSDIYRVNVQMYAEVIVDMDKSAGITITGESNLIDLISQKVSSGVLTLDQKKWIEPTRKIKIEIGAPFLREVEHGTHDKTKVINITGELFKVEAPIGDVVLQGEVEELRVKSKMGFVDGSALFCKQAIVKIKSDGKVKVNALSSVDCDIKEDGMFENIGEASNSSNCDRGEQNRMTEPVDTRFISLKIKNNSLRRNHFVVVGPKPDGRKFSYGFPLMPYQTKKERWTVGTKIYKENSIGMRTLLVTLTEEDEDGVVKLFE